jgi:hypothetical protein
MWHHETDSRRSNAGLPDIIAVRDGRLVFAELKTERGRLRPEQQAWRDELRRLTGAEYYIWRPRDWQSGAIERVLQ